MAILTVENLCKSYKKGFIPKKTEVLKSVSFQLDSGVVTGFLGANGAGKTTTMKCLLGLAFPDSGKVQYFGQQSLNNEVKKKIGFLPERPYFYDYLTGEEFLRFYGELSRRMTQKDIRSRIQYLLKKVDLEHARDRRLRDYSKGMLQKIGLAQALIHNPEFVILDEPMSGLDPDGRYYLSELISETAQKGTTIFFSSHLLNDTEKLCQNLVILKDGEIIYQGSTQNFISQIDVKMDITFIEGAERKTLQVHAGAELQGKIDELRKKQLEILEIKENKMSLEEAFIDKAMKFKKTVG